MRFINVDAFLFLFLFLYLHATRSLRKAAQQNEPRFFLSRHLSQFIQTSIIVKHAEHQTKAMKRYWYSAGTKHQPCWSVSSVYFGHIAMYKTTHKKQNKIAMHARYTHKLHTFASKPFSFFFFRCVGFFSKLAFIPESISLNLYGVSFSQIHTGKLNLGSIYCDFCFFLAVS